uniref:Uncharacterized protein n=1 Tax=Oryza brachyantha TaxID=4533 RepID=J3ML37_ORYBR
MSTKADLETLYGCEGDAAEHANDVGDSVAGHHDARDMLDPDEDAVHVDRHDRIEVGEVKQAETALHHGAHDAGVVDDVVEVACVTPTRAAVTTTTATTRRIHYVGSFARVMDTIEQQAVRPRVSETASTAAVTAVTVPSAEARFR